MIYSKAFLSRKQKNVAHVRNNTRALILSMPIRTWGVVIPFANLFEEKIAQSTHWIYFRNSGLTNCSITKKAKLCLRNYGVLMYSTLKILKKSACFKYIGGSENREIPNWIARPTLNKFTPIKLRRRPVKGRPCPFRPPLADQWSP